MSTLLILDFCGNEGGGGGGSELEGPAGHLTIVLQPCPPLWGSRGLLFPLNL